MWYNVNVKGRGKEWSERYPRKKINQKKVRKPLDKPPSLWYNKYVSEREFSTEHKPCPTKRLQNLVGKNF